MKFALILAGNLQDLISHLLGSAHRSPSLISWGLALDQMAANARPALPAYLPLMSSQWINTALPSPEKVTV